MWRTLCIALLAMACAFTFYWGLFWVILQLKAAYGSTSQYQFRLYEEDQAMRERADHEGGSDEDTPHDRD
jgi:hypothetical protein